MEPAGQPSEGIRLHLARRKGVRIDHALEQVTARHPTSQEAKLLGVTKSAPILASYAPPGGRLVRDGSVLAFRRGGSPGRGDRPAGPTNRRAKNLIF